jgi:hypothetical protein
MTAGILGKRFANASERSVPWWDMGWQPDEANIDLVTAVENAGADISVEKWELVAVKRDDDGSIVLTKRTPDFGIMREPVSEDNDWRYFAAVTGDYKMFQNKQLAKALQPINEVYPVETVGVIDMGKTAFFTFDAGEYTVNGEKNKHYIYASTGHDGKSGIRLGLTKVCIVCQNTYMMALNSSVVSLQISHKGDVEEATNNAVATLKGLERVIGTDVARDKQLGETEIAYGEAVEIIRASYPEPRAPRKVTMAGNAIASESMTKEQVKRLLTQQGGVGKLAEHYERSKERTELMRNTTVQVYDAYAKARPGIYGTTLGVFNSVTEVANWREGQNAEQSIMFGGVRAKTMDLAYKKVTEFAGVN